MYAKPIFVCALDNFRITINFSDWISGIVDLSHLAGKGVFDIWENDDNFSNVYINTETDAIAWNKDLEICPNNLFQQILLTKSTFQKIAFWYSTNKQIFWNNNF